MNIGVWNEEFTRTEQARLITAEIARKLIPIFDKAIRVGLSPEAFCFLVNESASTLALHHVVSNNLDFRKENI